MKFQPANFFKDEPTQMARLVAKLATGNYQGALILGNGPSFNLADDAMLEYYRERGYLTIGLNRSIYRHVTDILIWSDVETLKSILGPESRVGVRPKDPSKKMQVVQAVLPVGKPFRQQIDRWKEHQTFAAFSPSKLFMFRTVLTAALHLSYLAGLRKVALAGVDLDNRTYFFKNDLYDEKQPYELRSVKSIEGHFRGYSSHRIVKEVLESLAGRHGVDIEYHGDSQFLAGVEGIRRAGGERSGSRGGLRAGTPGDRDGSDALELDEC
jgi:hypothetical protein